MIPQTTTSRIVELLEAEADAIDRVATRLHPDQIERALELLAGCRGKVLVIGIGKSGIIAQKIAATMCSIGTVSLAMHPCDAMHGDLGVVGADDVAIVLSHSGESDEILTLLPHLKHRQVPIIAIVGKLDSSLARQADAIVDAGIEREICPHNLAPTSSAIVALALGDTLAMALMELKQITPELFAYNHPAGQLGKRLTLKVRDIMHAGDDNPTLTPEASWIDVVSAITQGGLGAVNIVDAQGRLLGLVTDGDLRRWMQKTPLAQVEDLQADIVMTTEPVTVLSEELAYEALKVMENRPSQISVLSVVDEKRCCLGLLRLHDIVRCGL